MCEAIRLFMFFFPLRPSVSHLLLPEAWYENVCVCVCVVGVELSTTESTGLVYTHTTLIYAVHVTHWCYVCVQKCTPI